MHWWGKPTSDVSAGFAGQGTVIAWLVCEEGVEVRGVGQRMTLQLGSNWVAIAAKLMLVNDQNHNVMVLQ